MWWTVEGTRQNVWPRDNHHPGWIHIGETSKLPYVFCSQCPGMSCSRLVVVRQTYGRPVVHVIEHVAVMSVGVRPHRCEHCKSCLCDGSSLWSTQHVLKIRWRSAFVRRTHCDIAIGGDLVDTTCKSKTGIGKFLYSAVSSTQDRSKRFTLYSVTDLFTQTPSRLLWEASSYML